MRSTARPQPKQGPAVSSVAPRQQRHTHGQAVEGFRDALASFGLGRPPIEADGHMHRFDLPDEHAGRKGGWYVFHPDNNPCPAGAFGSWRHGISETWSSRVTGELSPAQQQRLAERQAQAKAQRTQTRKREADAAARRAAAILAASPQATDEHPYLRRKQVRALGLKLGERNTLLAPLYDAAGEVRGLQRIGPDGEKRFLKGVDPKGAFGFIQGDTASIYLAEGYATGASLHQATGQAVALAFNADNLEGAARSVRLAFPQAALVIAADNDSWSTRPDGTPWNVGLEKARQAGEALNAPIRVPQFRDLATRPTDFNDLHCLEGLPAVQAQLTSQSTPAAGHALEQRTIQPARTTGHNQAQRNSQSTRITDHGLHQLNGHTPPPRQWLVKGTIPLDGAMILAAPGGTGKGMLMLDLALKVAGGPPATGDADHALHAFGHKIVQHGPVVLFAAEDDRSEIHRRASSLCGHFPRGLYVLCLPDMAYVHTPYAMVVESRAGCEATPWWRQMTTQLLAIRPRLVIVDPLACFVCADLNNRTVGAAVMGMFTRLARQCNAAVIAVHHLNKLPETLKELDAAKTKISGSAGFVDHARGAYALWPEEEQAARTLCRDLGVPYSHGRVIKGGLAKCNFPGDTGVKTFLRNDKGLLEEAAHQAAQRKAALKKQAIPGILDVLAQAIAHAAAAGQPYEHMGKHGLYERRKTLPAALRTVGRNALEGMGRALLEAKRVAKYRAKGSKAEVWLDVPEGPFAQGEGQLRLGDHQPMPDEDQTPWLPPGCPVSAPCPTRASFDEKR